MRKNYGLEYQTILGSIQRFSHSLLPFYSTRKEDEFRKMAVKGDKKEWYTIKGEKS